MDRRLILDRAAEAVAALNRGDARGWVAHMVEDVIWRDVALPMPIMRRDVLLESVERKLASIPDLHLDVTSLTFEGPRLAREWTVTGTHIRELMGLPPTGRAFRTYGVTIATFDDDGLLIEGTSYWNPLVMLQQLGARPASESVVTVP